MSDFKIQPHPLKANPLFMDIHKKKKHDTVPHEEKDAFDNIKQYNHKVKLLFSDLPDDFKFWLIDGTPLHNLHELYEAFDHMTDDLYSHHVTTEKNDFATWVSNMYHDEDLAYKLHKAKHRLSAKRAIEDRIEEIMNVAEEHTSEDSFFKALIKKLSKQNKKIEVELQEKKQWILRKQKELESWEEKNVEQEKRVFSRYHTMEQQEKQLLSKFQNLQGKEQKLKAELAKEKKEIDAQNRSLLEQRELMNKEHEQVKSEKQELEHRKNDIRHKRDLRIKTALSEKNRHIYERIDELLSYATASIYNHNYKEARDTMAKVKYYYTTLQNDDPQKKEIYKKVIRLRKHMTDTMRV